ncbi:MAG TPA: glycosyltransferase [Candidatus Saccharimonadia bacterium]|jgi:glycosyltransferase involved in cell wall biosynthesis|nr:glycosyltransferase [Candidatus Saccharimonadia bacterium]
MPAQPLISIIIPTRNSGKTLKACLASVTTQTYPHIETIVVDRDSQDATKTIAKDYTPHVYNHGPERSAQRNFGVSKAKGEYVAIIDSDMELTPKVVEACVQAMATDPQPKGVIIPEQSFGEGFWAQCKALERSYYVGSDDIEAARFFTRKTYQDLGGYDETLVAGEDWDLSNRARAQGPIARVSEFIRHNEGHISLIGTLRKKYYYAQHAKAYLQKSQTSSMLTANAGPLQRYKLFLSRPGRLLRNPFTGLGMLFMKTAEYAAGAAGLLTTSSQSKGHAER